MWVNEWEKIIRRNKVKLNKLMKCAATLLWGGILMQHNRIILNTWKCIHVLARAAWPVARRQGLRQSPFTWRLTRFSRQRNYPSFRESSRVQAIRVFVQPSQRAVLPLRLVQAGVPSALPSSTVYQPYFWSLHFFFFHVLLETKYFHGCVFILIVNLFEFVKNKYFNPNFCWVKTIQISCQIGVEQFGSWILCKQFFLSLLNVEH